MEFREPKYVVTVEFWAEDKKNEVEYFVFKQDAEKKAKDFALSYGSRAYVRLCEILQKYSIEVVTSHVRRPA